MLKHDWTILLLYQSCSITLTVLSQGCWANNPLTACDIFTHVSEWIIWVLWYFRDRISGDDCIGTCFIHMSNISGQGEEGMHVPSSNINLVISSSYHLISSSRTHPLFSKCSRYPLQRVFAVVWTVFCQHVWLASWIQWPARRIWRFKLRNCKSMHIALFFTRAWLKM